MFAHDRLDRSVDAARDQVLGPADAEFTVVEYGSYACPHCRAANEQIAEVRNRFGERMRYVFRHRPLTGTHNLLGQLDEKIVQWIVQRRRIAGAANLPRSCHEVQNYERKGIRSGLRDSSVL